VHGNTILLAADFQRFPQLILSALRGAMVPNQLDAFSKKLGRRIRDIRVTKGLSQAAVCRAVGLSIDTLSRMERGDGQEPKLGTLLKVATGLKIELCDLFPPFAEETATALQSELVTIIKHLDADGQQAILTLLRRRS